VGVSLFERKLRVLNYKSAEHFKVLNSQNLNANYYCESGRGHCPTDYFGLLAQPFISNSSPVL
jgi:hypothetical protein